MIIENSGYKNQQKNKKIGFKAAIIPQNTHKLMHRRMMNAISIDEFCHVSPDEDTLNATKVMANFLVSEGKEVRIFAEGKLKGLLKTGLDEKVRIIDPDKTAELEIADLAFVVDCNSKNRVPRKSAEFLDRYQKSNIMGIDHHKPNKNDVKIGNIINPFPSDNTTKSLLGKLNIFIMRLKTEVFGKNPFYVDETAKSCCGIVYRFFEGLRIKLDDNNLGNLYCGMLNDISKSNCIKLITEDGIDKVIRLDELKKFSQTEELLNKIEAQLSSAKKTEILRHLNIMANLTPEETAFHKKLFTDMVQFSKNGKLAYIVIEPENQEWKNLGQDNIITSVILSDVRKRLLENSPEDKLIPSILREKLEKVKGVIIFYRGDEKAVISEEVYKMSIHSKDGYAGQLINEYIKNNPGNNNPGGHPDRSGGRIYSIETDKCNKFINGFLTAAETNSNN